MFQMRETELMISSKILFEVCDSSSSVVAISYVGVCFYLNPREEIWGWQKAGQCRGFSVWL